MLSRLPVRVLAWTLLVSAALILPASLAAAQQQYTWSGSAAFSAGTRLGTSLTAGGQLVLATLPPTNWTKYAGNPVVTPSQAWDPTWAIAPDILYEGGVYKMWYAGCSGSCSIGYATSTDGTTWTPYAGNPVLSANASSWDTSFGPARVIHDGSVYRMWYTGDGGFGIRIGYATSSDGIHWTKYGTTPVFNGTMAWDSGAVNTPAVAKVGSQFVMYFSGTNGSGGYSYSMGRATSLDGISWTEYSGNPVLVAQGGWEGNRVHPSWFSVGTNGYDLYYSGGTVGTPVQVGHATSPDGLTWTEDPANPVLTPGASGSWDAWAVAHPYLVTVGSQLRMYFTGYDTSSNSVLQIGYATFGPSSGGYVGEGSWVSDVYDSGNPNTTWSSLSWVASMPPNTGVGAAVQVGNTSVPDYTWTLSPPSLTTPTTLRLPTARYARVIVALVSLGGSQTPTVSAVSVTFETPTLSPGPGLTVYWGLGLVGFLALVALAVGAGVAFMIVILTALRSSRGGPVPGAPAVLVLAACPYCGSPVPAGNRFCGRCGNPVTPPGGGPPPGV